MKLPTVAELRKDGWKVGVHHEHHGPLTRDHFSVARAHVRLSPQGRDIGPGWRTDVVLTPPQDSAKYEGESYHGIACCNPKDGYDRRLGLTIALGRALKVHKKAMEAP